MLIEILQPGKNLESSIQICFELSILMNETILKINEFFSFQFLKVLNVAASTFYIGIVKNCKTNKVHRSVCYDD